MRKPRPSSGLKAQLEALPVEQFNAFHAMLRENLTYAQMLARAKADFGLQTSATAIGEYYKTGHGNGWMARAGEQTIVTLARFELLISCPSPGVVSIMAKELPPAHYCATEPEQSPADQKPQGDE